MIQAQVKVQVIKKKLQNWISLTQKHHLYRVIRWHCWSTALPGESMAWKAWHPWHTVTICTITSLGKRGKDVLVIEVLTLEQVVILDFARITPDQISQLHISEMLYYPYDSSEGRVWSLLIEENQKCFAAYTFLLIRKMSGWYDQFSNTCSCWNNAKKVKYTGKTWQEWHSADSCKVTTLRN